MLRVISVLGFRAYILIAYSLRDQRERLECVVGCDLNRDILLHERKQMRCLESQTVTARIDEPRWFLCFPYQHE